MTYINQVGTIEQLFPTVAAPAINQQEKDFLDTNSPNAAEWYQNWCQPPSYTQKKHETRQSQILTTIRALYAQSGKKPSNKQLRKIAHCDYSTAKPALEAFDEELQARENWETLLIYVNSAKKISYSIGYTSQQSIDNATYALFDLYPNNVYLLTFVCPGNAEEPYLAIARNSQLVVSNLMTNLQLLLPNDIQLHYLYAWEVQDREAPHLHVLLNLPNDETLTEGQLASIWLSVLNELGDYYHINMFSNYDKPDYSPNDPHILAHTANLKKFHLSQNPNYQHTYLGKKVSKTPRPLTIANNKPVAFVRWGGVSDSLKPHVQALSLKERIPVDCKDQVFEDIETAKALIESVASVNWKDHFSYYDGQKHNLGYKARLQPKEFKQVKELLEQHAIALQSKRGRPFAPRPIYFVVLELHPNGKCFLKQGFSKSNYKLDQLEYKARKRKR